MKEGPELHLFQHLAMDLNSATEKLSHMLEHEAKAKAPLVAETATTLARLAHFIEGIEDGVINGVINVPTSEASASAGQVSTAGRSRSAKRGGSPSKRSKMASGAALTTDVVNLVSEDEDDAASQLLSMGFLEEAKNRQALEQVGGHLRDAIAILIASREDDE